jgi:hypothetical protein
MFVAFDALALAGRDLRHLRWRDRRRVILEDAPSMCEQHRKQHRRPRPQPNHGYQRRRWRNTRDAYATEHPRCETPGCTKPVAVVHHLDGLGPLRPAAWIGPTCAASATTTGSSPATPSSTTSGGAANEGLPPGPR